MYNTVLLNHTCKTPSPRLSTTYENEMLSSPSKTDKTFEISLYDFSSRGGPRIRVQKLGLDGFCAESFLSKKVDFLISNQISEISDPTRNFFLVWPDQVSDNTSCHRIDPRTNFNWAIIKTPRGDAVRRWSNSMA